MDKLGKPLPRHSNPETEENTNHNFTVMIKLKKQVHKLLYKMKIKDYHCAKTEIPFMYKMCVTLSELVCPI